MKPWRGAIGDGIKRVEPERPKAETRRATLDLIRRGCQSKPEKDFLVVVFLVELTN